MVRVWVQVVYLRLIDRLGSKTWELFSIPAQRFAECFRVLWMIEWQCHRLIMLRLFGVLCLLSSRFQILYATSPVSAAYWHVMSLIPVWYDPVCVYSSIYIMNNVCVGFKSYYFQMPSASWSLRLPRCESFIIVADDTRYDLPTATELRPAWTSHNEPLFTFSTIRTGWTMMNWYLA